MRDYRVWWALFVFFGVLCVRVLQRRYGRWRRARDVLAAMHGPAQIEQARRLRLEGWRLAFMAGSLLAMTALVFAALAGAPPALLFALRLLAIGAVLGLVLIGLRL